MFIMTNAKSIEKFTAQTEEALQPIEALLRAWSHEMEPEKDVTHSTFEGLQHVANDYCAPRAPFGAPIERVRSRCFLAAEAFLGACSRIRRATSCAAVSQAGEVRAVSAGRRGGLR